MKEINLKVQTEKVECETISIKTAIVVEEITLENVIPKKIRKEVEKLLIEELKNAMILLKNSKQNYN
jgi:UDP-N-acetylglucosamine enolpyruvyl transferase